MRTVTGSEFTVLQSAFRRHSIKLEIENAAGSFIDRTSFLLSATFGADVDQPIGEARVKLRRDNGVESLSPFRGDSPLNAGGAAIDAGRAIRISPATTAYGSMPVAGDYKLLFLGTIDSVDFATSTIELVARDQGGALVDAWIEANTVYGSEAGTPLEDVIQDILDNWGGGVVLYTPLSPGFMVAPAYEQEKSSVWDAIRLLAALPGWDIRYLWDDGTSAFRLTLFEPDRLKTTPDWTFAADRYFDVTQLAISREFVRNVIDITYTDSASAARSTATAEDATSIARFGRRWMEIELASDNPIDTAIEAQTLADAALSDLAWPVAEQEIELPFFWPVDLGDLGRFLANGVHYDDDMDLAVTGYAHELNNKSERTRVSVRGKPAGFYRDWIRRGNAGVTGVTDEEIIDALSLHNFREVSRDTAANTITYEASPGPNVAEVWIYDRLFDNPPPMDPWPDADDIPDSIEPAVDPMQFVFRIPLPGEIRYIQLEPRGATLSEVGLVQRLIISPLLDPPDRIVAIQALVFDNDGSVSVRVDAADKTLSYRYAFAVFPLGTPGTDPTDAAVEAGTVRTISGSDSFTLPANTVAYNQGFRIKAAPYINADGTGKDSSAAEHGEIKTAEDIRLMPPVSLEITTETKTATTGTFGVTVRDASAKATALYYRTQAAGSAPTSWTLKSSTPTNGVEYQQTITLEEGHSVYVEFRLDYLLNGSAGEVHQKSNGFDKGKIPNIAIVGRISQAGAVSANVDGDVDTLSVRILAWEKSVYPGDAAAATAVRAATARNGRNLTPDDIGTLVTINIGQSAIIAAFGYSQAAGAGNESTAMSKSEVARTAKNAPEILESWTRVGSTAGLVLNISDKLLKVTAVEFNKREGTGAATGWITSWDSSTGTIGSSVALTRGESVAIVPGLDSIINWRVTFTDENGAAQIIGNGLTTANLETVFKTLRITATGFSPWDQNAKYSLSPGLLYSTRGGGINDFFYSPLDLPQGVTMVGLRARMTRTVTGDAAAVRLHRVIGDTTSVAFASLIHTGTGQATSSVGISENTSGYYYALEFESGQFGGGDIAGLLWVEIDYNTPDYSKTI